MWMAERNFHASGGSIFRQEEGGFFLVQILMAQALRPGAAGGAP